MTAPYLAWQDLYGIVFAAQEFPLFLFSVVASGDL